MNKLRKFVHIPLLDENGLPNGKVLQLYTDSPLYISLQRIMEYSELEVSHNVTLTVRKNKDGLIEIF